jgi:hypothetical protein
VGPRDQRHSTGEPIGIQIRQYVVVPSNPGGLVVVVHQLAQRTGGDALCVGTVRQWQMKPLERADRLCAMTTATARPYGPAVTIDNLVHQASVDAGCVDIAALTAERKTERIAMGTPESRRPDATTRPTGVVPSLRGTA